MAPTRMTGRERREQVLAVAELEFAAAGLRGASIETIAHFSSPAWTPRSVA